MNLRKKRNEIFRKRGGGGVKGRSEIFRKFIRFRGDRLPLGKGAKNAFLIQASII